MRFIYAEPTKTINVLVRIKGDEKYVFIYSDDRKSEVMKTFGRFAVNPQLSFAIDDAIELTQSVREG